MKERPILFSGPMVRAILDGRKTQTRRVMKHQTGAKVAFQNCPYGQPWDRLWVRETISAPFASDLKAQNFTGFYRASDADRQVRWIPSIHMPRWASRLTLEIVRVRVEQLQDISDADAKAEGVEQLLCGFRDYSRKLDCQLGDARMSYYTLWESINGTGAWAKNPWVWVVEFRRLQ